MFSLLSFFFVDSRIHKLCWWLFIISCAVYVHSPISSTELVSISRTRCVAFACWNMRRVWWRFIATEALRGVLYPSIFIVIVIAFISTQLRCVLFGQFHFIAQQSSRSTILNTLPIQKTYKREKFSLD